MKRPDLMVHAYRESSARRTTVIHADTPTATTGPVAPTGPAETTEDVDLLVVGKDKYS